MAKRYIEFDGLRGWLALWVVLAHIFCWCGASDIQATGKIGAVWKGFTAADAAVETFIILSGFAIHTLLLREPRPYLRYMTGRFFRIYPVYLFSLLLSLALAPTVIQLVPSLPWSQDYYLQWMDRINDAQSARPAAHAFWHGTLLHGILPKQALDYATTTLLKPAWSISLEWQFYLAAPLIALCLCRSWGIAILLAGAAVGQLTRGMWENPDNAFLLRWLPMFLIGMVCAEFAARCEKQEGLARRAGPALIGIGAGLAVFFCNRPMSLVLWLLIFSVSIGAWEGFFPLIGRGIGGFMRLRVAQWLGALSYPLYLLHWPFIVGMLAFLQWSKPELQQSDTFVVMLMSGIPLLLGFAWIVHVCLEKPMMRLGRRITLRPEPGGEVSVNP
jgi:peptidoglycan/LPS O-acetylase OafA/YrhL